MWPLEAEVMPQDRAAAAALGRELGVAVGVGQLLLARGISQPHLARRFLHPRLADLSPPEAMADRAVAADRLARACRTAEHVAVFGDYDVDGTCSASILSDVLEILGARVTTLVADRFRGGYGLSAPGLERVLETGATLVVTCDCGSADHDRLESLGAAGRDAIVVDHHLVPERPLPVLAFLNPHRPECGFPFDGLCSAGLALSLSAAVRATLGVQIDLRRWLDLVALATVADVVPLRGDNRALVRAGLATLAAPDVRPGIAALRDSSGIRSSFVVAGDIAFRLAPRLNAPGRLGAAERTIALLRCRSAAEGRTLAAAVESDNTRRKTIERAVTREAIAQVVDVYGPSPTGGVVAAGEGWHRGVVGIVAARLVDRFGVPALVAGVEDGLGHGSGRAPKGFELHTAVSRCASELVGFGGHQAALGFALRPERLDALRAAFSDSTRDLLAAGSAPSPRRIELVVDGYAVPAPPAKQLFLLEPLGMDNADPLVVLAGARIEECGAVGDGHLKMRVKVGNQSLAVFGYGRAERRPPPGESVLDLVGHLRPDSWRGGDAVELRLPDPGR